MTKYKIIKAWNHNPELSEGCVIELDEVHPSLLPHLVDLSVDDSSSEKEALAKAKEEGKLEAKAELEEALAKAKEISEQDIIKYLSDAIQASTGKNPRSDAKLSTLAKEYEELSK